MVMSDINRFSHVVMDGSLVRSPLGLQRVKAAALRLFGGELRSTHVEALTPGRALPLLPPASLPTDMHWAIPNSRIADALARWAAVVERETSGVVSPAVRELLARNLQDWKGDLMPISRRWVDSEVSTLTGQDRAIARLALVIAKAPYQVDEGLVEDVVSEDRREERFIRVLAWARFPAPAGSPSASLRLQATFITCTTSNISANPPVSSISREPPSSATLHLAC
jgi:hypothetical protein